MSNFLEKSKQNLNAGDILIRSGFPNSSIHCSYYAAVQYMFHLIFTKFGKTKDEFNAELNYHKKGTHVWAEKLVCDELEKISFQEYKWFKKNFPEFKDIRVKSDYTEELIDKEKGIEALEKSRLLIETLKSNLG
jgi:hypothetical protein